MRQILIHCGVHKTGTSSIQRVLSANRPGLLELGILYPSFRSNHFELYSAFCEQPLYYHANRLRGITSLEEVAAARANTLELLEAELSKHSRSNVVISSEDFSAMTETEMAEFVSYLRSLGFSRISFILYLRDHISYWESSLQQRIKGGVHIQLAEGLAAHPIKSYKPFLKTLSAVAKPEDIYLRIFDRSTFPNGDVVADFLEVARLRNLTLAASDQVNTSISWPAMLALNELNRRWKVYTAAGRSILFDDTVKELRHHRGPPFAVTREMAERIFEASADDRQYLSGWFDGRDPFAQIMRSRIEQAPVEHKQPTPEQVMDVLAELYAAAQLRAAKNKASQLGAMTKLARLSNNPDRADAVAKRRTLLLKRLAAQ
jgi:hypothetical protein